MRQVPDDVKALLKGFNNNTKGTNPVVILLEDLVARVNTSQGDGIPTTTVSPYGPHDIVADPNQMNFIGLPANTPYRIILPVEKNPQHIGEYIMDIHVSSTSTLWGPAEAGRTQPEALYFVLGDNVRTIGYTYVLGEDTNYSISATDEATSEEFTYYRMDVFVSEEMHIYLSYTVTMVEK